MIPENANVQHKFEIMFLAISFLAVDKPGCFRIVKTGSQYRGFGNVMMAIM